VPSPELAAEIKAAAERTEALAPGRDIAARAWANYYTAVALDNAKARAALERALPTAANRQDILASMAQMDQALNHWDGTLEPLQRAAALDPRSAVAAGRVGITLLYLRRYAEAKVAYDHAIALAPSDVNVIEQRMMVSLAEGDLPGARAVMAASAGSADPDALLVFLAMYQDLYWVLDDAEQQKVLGFPAAVYDGDSTSQAIVRAQLYDLRGDRRRASAAAAAARRGFMAQVRDVPEDGQRHVLLGLSLALMGDKAGAIAEGRRGVELWPISRDATQGAYVQLQLARIYMLVGEPDLAMDQLEPLLKMPHYISPAWLRIDPTWARLKDNPRFRRLAAMT
jgi:tetratricopeptide (TPR) repeat protein